MVVLLCLCAACSLLWRVLFCEVFVIVGTCRGSELIGVASSVIVCFGRVKNKVVRCGQLHLA